MLGFLESLLSSFGKMGLRDFIDIALVAIIVYYLLKFTKNTRASQVLKGLGLIIVLAYVCGLLKLPTVSWLLTYIIEAGAVLVVIIFQPEIRRALEKLGRKGIFDITSKGTVQTEDDPTDDLVKAITNLSKHKTGALIVLAQKTGLKEVVDSGTRVDAAISAELIGNLFFKNSPLHDGAVIIKDKRIVAAGCFLPLSDNRELSSSLGTRHRAAVGISEVSDSITIIVSEETGIISCARDGSITRNLDGTELRNLISDSFAEESTQLRKVSFKKRTGGKDEKDS